MPARRVVAIALVPVLSASVVGCGGSKKTTAHKATHAPSANAAPGEVTATVKGYITAVFAGDAAKACGLLAPAAVSELQQMQYLPKGGCAAGIKKLPSNLSGGGLFTPQDYTSNPVSSIKVTGSKATANLCLQRDCSTYQPVKLEQVGGSWKITRAPHP